MSIVDLDAKILAVFLKHVTGELGPMSVMILFMTPNLQMTDFMNLTVDCLLILTTRVAFGHLVNLSMMTYRYRNPLMALGNGPRMSSPHMANGHEGGIICSVCACDWIRLACLASLY
jgi:hypothetical protein